MTTSHEHEPANAHRTPPVSVVESPTAPAVSRPRWSGRKTAVAAALAIGVASAGTAAAATAAPAGSLQTQSSEHGRLHGGRDGHRPPDGMPPAPRGLSGSTPPHEGL
ncbi:hypothetical protein [Mobilicoccus massiliensis]|uniref:hypothetical protein n=1 Tax=Mobilicoccus massiliensis TaxID=1522310 RepID=UPI00058E2319|nr:hypothetical protein [Mobilicoccus massiliensis]